MSLSLGQRMNWLWLFPAIGVLIIAIAAVLFSARMRFEASALHADGEVIDLLHSQSTDSDGNRSTTWCPEVRFVDRGGRETVFSGSVCSQPASHAVGERVTVLYPDGAPQRARLDGFADRWLGVLVVGGIGAVFSLIGFGIVLPMLATRRRAVDLRRSGRPVMATVVEVARNESFEVNGRSPWRIHAQWQDGVGGKLHLFESENLWFDPSPYVGPEIRVMISPHKPKHYWMDISTLPQVA